MIQSSDPNSEVTRYTYCFTFILKYISVFIMLLNIKSSVSVNLFCAGEIPICHLFVNNVLTSQKYVNRKPSTQLCTIDAIQILSANNIPTCGWDIFSCHWLVSKYIPPMKYSSVMSQPGYEGNLAMRDTTVRSSF